MPDSEVVVKKPIVDQLLVLVGVQVQVSQAVVYYPYYFGETSFSCLGKKKGRKRRSNHPTRYTLKLTHRYLFYRGYYFEFGERGRKGPNDLNVSTKKWGSSSCPSGKETSVAGRSKVTVSCLKKCAEKYTSRYGDYAVLSNNCHHFANRMSEVLYNDLNNERLYGCSCPPWCR
ncbi:hypothetical protein MAR_002952 [Mya arenaria]|uniref:LRAT domain-containing protein n=1 Tax=Mya arenaria TaxID=6604 RepID=A0ABY7G763_MYAAR|nr:hypothetical protein MAR_002952 [Mya arenaria]